MFQAVSPKSVRFHQLHDHDGARIKQERVCSADGEPVSYPHIVKGFEIEEGRYVKVTPAELDAFEAPSTRVIGIEEFVDLHDIDPIYYEQTYYLSPAPEAERPYALLHAALVRRRKVAVGRVVLRHKQHVAVIRPRGPALSLSTLRYADEILPASSLEGLPDETAAPRERELEAAEQLVESLSARFRPERYRDEHRERLLDFLHHKAEGLPAAAPPPDELAAPSDLMRALDESLDAVRSRPPTDEAA